ncbi:hypothetical protein GCM10010232_70480 [Streptomyces amakusaensis]|uniref:Secreted protein n=1 Tax=Streptomyces amakusaensis TaxID=67271 RepID=A0ABW0ATZ9_9ACTN
MDFIKHVGTNQAAFTVIVACLAILGGIVGNWISAWLQSRAGRAQAAAAKEAARITAEAQRLAALYTDRRVLLARLVETTRLVHTAIVEASEPSSGNASRDGVTTIWPLVDQMRHQQTELSLVAPEDVMQSCGILHKSTQDSIELLVERGPARWAQARLDGMPGADAARAREVLDELRECHREELPEGDIELFRDAARQALRMVPGLEDPDPDALVGDVWKVPAQPLFHAATQKNAASLAQLINQARQVLSAERVDTACQ